MDIPCAMRPILATVKDRAAKPERSASVTREIHELARSRPKLGPASPFSLSEWGPEEIHEHCT